jgi:hypothetical protein
METSRCVGSAPQLGIAGIWTRRGLSVRAALRETRHAAAREPVLRHAWFGVVGTVLATWLVTAGAQVAVGTATDEPAGRVAVEIRPGHAVMSNGLLRIETQTGKQHPGDTVLHDLRRGTDIALSGDQFALELAGGNTVRSTEMQLVKVTEERAPSVGRVRLDFRHGDLRVRLVTELQAKRPWATRWLEIRSNAAQDGPTAHLAAVQLAHWQHASASGPAAAGEIVGALGFPEGCGQAVYAGGFFFAIAHPGAENFAVDGTISCRIPAVDRLGPTPVRTRGLVLGSGGRRELLHYVDATRAVPSRMVFLANDWYWKDKSRPLKAIRALSEIKRQSGVPIDSFTLDDGWDFDWDSASGLWGRLNRKRFPGGWEALEAAGRPADINISLWLGPIGGYGYRPKRIAFARKAGYEIVGDKLCLAGPRYRRHLIDSFSHWAQLGMDYIKVDGFWPNCSQRDHGHPVGPGGAIAQMDALIDVFHAWRRARPDLLIGYTSGSNPSPFWLQHADYVWRGGRDDSHAGEGPPFDRHNTFLDTCLNVHRQTDMPISAFVTFDIVTDRIAGNEDDAFERGFWWLAARTSLHHDWYLQADDLTIDRWKMLARASHWAKRHASQFRWSRMVGGDPAHGEIYGFSAFDGSQGTLALRNPSLTERTISASLAGLLELPAAEQKLVLQLRGVFGETGTLEGEHLATKPINLTLPPLAIALFEVRTSRTAARAPRETALGAGLLTSPHARP